MTHFLKSDDNPEGYKLEDILRAIRKDVIKRCTKIIDDPAPSAQEIIANNMTVLTLLTEAIDLADESTQLLNKKFNPPNADGSPRIGEA